MEETAWRPGRWWTESLLWFGAVLNVGFYLVLVLSQPSRPLPVLLAVTVVASALVQGVVGWSVWRWRYASGGRAPVRYVVLTYVVPVVVLLGVAGISALAGL